MFNINLINPILGKVSNQENFFDLINGAEKKITVNDSLGDLFIDKKEFEKGILYYKQVINDCEIALEFFSINKEFINKQTALKENFFYNKISAMNNKIYSSYYNSGNDFFEKEEWENALNTYKETFNHNVRDYFIYFRIALCLKNLKQYFRAKDFFEDVLVLNNQFYDCYREIGDISTIHLKDDKQAIENYEIYLSFEADNFNVLNMLGHLYNKTGKIIKSFEYLRKSIDLKPDFREAVNNLLYTSHKVPDYSQKEIYELTKTYTSKYLEAISFLDSDIYKHNKGKNKENKKIRIGYISGDFRNHVVMCYILPILKNHDREKFEIYLYSNTEEADDVTEKCKSLSDKFYDINKLSDKEVSEKIYNDEIDILIDLSGHTSLNRVFVLAYKPAPVQLTYVGFPNTTGLTSIDYFITNYYLNKKEEEQYFSEKLLFTESVYRCYEAITTSEFPELKPPPVLSNEYIVFGSFNDLSKINDNVIETWSEILKEIPNSKLYICRTSIIEDFIYEKFEKFGIGKERIILDKEFSQEKYNNIDIHLDTFPYSGVTVVFDSLIMGVPVITLYGDTFSGREAANINFVIGLDNLIAKDRFEYIDICKELSKDKRKLEEYKFSLRDRLFKSPFYQHKEFTENFENSLKRILYQTTELTMD